MRVDKPSNGIGLCCKVTCLLTHSEFLSFVHLLERIDSWSHSRRKRGLILQRRLPPALEHDVCTFVQSNFLSQALTQYVTGANIGVRIFVSSVLPPCVGSSDEGARAIHVYASATDARLNGQ